MIKLLKKLSHATLAAFIALTGVFAAACVDPVDPDPPKDYGLSLIHRGRCRRG